MTYLAKHGRTPEHHWGWLLRHMKGETVYEIAIAEDSKPTTVFLALRRLGVAFDRRVKSAYPVGVAKAYANQRRGAKNRGIRWEFTKETWWEVWRASGKWEYRGSCQGQYVMARYNDSGPYAAWNVRIVTCGDNVREAVQIRYHQQVALRRQEREAA